jgi:hypothetical protein
VSFEDEESVDAVIRSAVPMKNPTGAMHGKQEKSLARITSRQAQPRPAARR